MINGYLDYLNITMQSCAVLIIEVRLCVFSFVKMHYGHGNNLIFVCMCICVAAYI